MWGAGGNIAGPQRDGNPVLLGSDFPGETEKEVKYISPHDDHRFGLSLVPQDEKNF